MGGGGAAADGGDGGVGDELGLQEIALRSLEFTRLRLTLEACYDGMAGGYIMRCGLAASLRIELPAPWFVPRVAIEAAGGLLLKVGLKLACDQLLREIEWLDQHEARNVFAGGRRWSRTSGS